MAPPLPNSKSVQGAYELNGSDRTLSGPRELQELAVKERQFGMSSAHPAGYFRDGSVTKTHRLSVNLRTPLCPEGDDSWEMHILHSWRWLECSSATGRPGDRERHLRNQSLPDTCREVVPQGLDSVSDRAGEPVPPLKDFQAASASSTCPAPLPANGGTPAAPAEATEIHARKRCQLARLPQGPMSLPLLEHVKASTSSLSWREGAEPFFDQPVLATSPMSVNFVSITAEHPSTAPTPPLADCQPLYSSSPRSSFDQVAAGSPGSSLWWNPMLTPLDPVFAEYINFPQCPSSREERWSWSSSFGSWVARAMMSCGSSSLESPGGAFPNESTSSPGTSDDAAPAAGDGGFGSTADLSAVRAQLEYLVLVGARTVDLPLLKALTREGSCREPPCRGGVGGDEGAGAQKEGQGFPLWERRKVEPPPVVSVCRRMPPV